MKRHIKRLSRAAPRSSDGSCEVDLFDPASISAASEAMSALGNPARLRLLLALDGRELCVCDCSQVLGASLSGTSQHLKELRRMGAITFRAQGKMAYYRLADHRWLRIAEAALQAIDHPATDEASA